MKITNLTEDSVNAACWRWIRASQAIVDASAVVLAKAEKDSSVLHQEGWSDGLIEAVRIERIRYKQYKALQRGRENPPEL